jgi:hydroxyacylglutathione hydrolase
MTLAPPTRVHPGHREPTTIEAEWESNPFVGVWRGAGEPSEERCSVWGREATLRLWAPDYDGGNKAWVLFTDSGDEAIVGGSQVQRTR